MTTEHDDPFHHLHDEGYADVFARGRVGSGDMIFMGGRQTVSLDGEWRFVLDLFDEGLRQKWYEAEPSEPTTWQVPRDYDGGDWQTAPVPSCWNLLKPEWAYFEGAAWYTRLLDLPELTDGERLFLRIGAANYAALVFLNGTFIGSHQGGSTPFFLDLTEARHDGGNRLQIMVENRRTATRVPMHHIDWFNYGGLYREIAMVRVPAVFIRDVGFALVPGSDGRRIVCDVTLSESVDGTAHLSIPALRLEADIAVTAGVGRLDIEALPDLWSPDRPALYDIELSHGQDRVSDRVGFREIAVSGRDILLNGDPIYLRGICVHEDDLDLGRCTSEADIRRRLAHARELNANCLRLAHYPHHEAVARIADELGFLLWQEVPVYWAIAFEDPGTYADAHNQLLEMVRRDRNRASVIIWGVGNENADTDARYSFMSRLAEAARAADPTPLVSAACLINRETFRIEDRLARHLDLIGINEYFGWHEPSYEGLERLLANSSPEKPVVISETGADALPGLRRTDEALFSEERQATFYERQLSILGGSPLIQGIFPWLLYDFRTERRQTALQRGFNRKGLIAADKATKKLAFETLAAFYARRAVMAAAPSGSSPAGRGAPGPT